MSAVSSTESAGEASRLDPKPISDATGLRFSVPNDHVQEALANVQFRLRSAADRGRSSARTLSAGGPDHPKPYKKADPETPAIPYESFAGRSAANAPRGRWGGEPRPPRRKA